MKKYWILIVAIILVLIGLAINLYESDAMSYGLAVKDYFAAGNFSIGVFSAGNFSIGIFSIGIFSIGIFSIGIFNIGLFTIGIFVLGWHKKLPKMLSKQDNI